MPTTMPSDPFAAVGGWLLVATLGTLVLGAGLLLWGRCVHRILLLGSLAAVGLVVGGPLAGRVGLETWAGRLIAAAALGLLGYLLARAIWSVVAGGMLAAAAAIALAVVLPGQIPPATSPAAPPAGGVEAAPVSAPAPPAAPVAGSPAGLRPSVWDLAVRFGTFIRTVESPRLSRQDARDMWSALGLEDIIARAKAHCSLLTIAMLGAGAAGLVGGFLLPRFTVILVTSALGAVMLAAAAAVACVLWMPTLSEHCPANYLALDAFWLGVLLVGLIFQGICEYRHCHPAPVKEEGDDAYPNPPKGGKAG